MNTLESVTQQLEKLREIYRAQWRAAIEAERARITLGLENSSGGAAPPPQAFLIRLLPSKSSQEPAATGAGKNRQLLSAKKKKNRSPISLALACTLVTAAIGHRFYSKPKLDVGTQAPYTITAPESAKVEDAKTTEENRRKALIGSIPVLRIDPALNQQIYDKLQRTLEQGNKLRLMAGVMPFTQTSILSAPTQKYLRQAREGEWQAILSEWQNQATSKGPIIDSWPKEVSQPLEQLKKARRQISADKLYRGVIKYFRPSLNAAGKQAFAELKAYQQKASVADFFQLQATISSARRRYFNATATLSELSVSQLNHAYDTELFDLSATAWQEMQEGIYKAAARILAQGISPGLPKDILRNALSLQVRAKVPPEAESVATQVLLAVVQPNLTADLEATRFRAEQAVKEVEPAYVTVQKGEAIVIAGERITHADLVLLDYFGKSQREPNWLGLLGFGALVGGAVGIFWLVERQFHPGLRRRDACLVLLLTLSTPLLVALQVPSTSLPAIGLLTGSFYGSALGVTVVSLLAGLLPLGLEIDGIYLIASAAGGLLGGLLAGRMRSREELALLGIAVGLTQGAVYLIVALIASSTAGSVWYSVLSTAGLQSLFGLAWSIVALGLSPYLEQLFDLVTPIRLAELANPNRPMLKRLAAEAPGTFQHTLFVATLAEAAARELGCNVELVRTGTLYHDIGKMHDPLGFIENQMGGPNKHDLINDPWKSAQIIKKHVSEGVLMARKIRLPTAIERFIPEHQGTMSIAYFYHQAQQMAKADPAIAVREEDFCYDGPIPQSRETGIVMLADSCEAALRSLKDATPEEALNMVNKILRARWQDNQLVDSGLTREEMSKIAEIFVQVWQQFHHKRIAYPKSVPPAN